MSLSTSVLHDDGVALLALGGELDLEVLPQVRRSVDQVLSSGLRVLVVDLTGLTFCDSSGLGALLRASRSVREAGGRCFVAGAHGPVLRLMSLTDLGQVLELSPDVRAALRAAHAELELPREV